MKTQKERSAEEAEALAKEEAKAKAENRRYMALVRKFSGLFKENKRAYDLTKEYVKNLSDDAVFSMYGFNKTTVMEAINYDPKKAKK
jgi:hypothetical protein